MPPQHPSPHPNIQNARGKLIIFCEGRRGGSYPFADLKKKTSLIMEIRYIENKMYFTDIKNIHKQVGTELGKLS